MITEQAIKRTIDRLRKRQDFERYRSVVVVLRVLIEEQEAVDEEHEQQHIDIINEIGQF